jgi:PP-loop superfamily ATP-utilizing enzyme
MRRFCRTCLFYEGMRFWLHPRTLPAHVLPVTLGEDGCCSVCRAYRRVDAPALRAMETDYFLAACGGRATAMFSGGKDSAAMLIHARATLGLDLIAVLLDNGFVPVAVVDRARDLCARLDVPLQVVKPSAAGAAALGAAVDQVTADTATPCLICAREVVANTLAVDVRHDGHFLLQGTNYFASWRVTPEATLVSSYEDTPVRILNLPYALGFTAQNTAAVLASAGYAPASPGGVSSNCRVPRLVQDRITEALGHVPELEDLSLEVIVGHLGRAEALERLRRAAPEHAYLLTGA